MIAPTQFIHIPGLLSAAQMEQIETLISASEFEDGRKTAGGIALKVKKNEQMSPGEAREKISHIVMEAMQASPLFRSGAMPRKVYPPIVSRYRPGMTYGYHVDGPVMGAENPVRTDLACTIFLRDPITYDGGELIVQSPVGTVPFKLPKGDAILYPANTVHGVAEVRSGERVCVVTWIQSTVRDPLQREILFQMNYLMQQAQASGNPESVEVMWTTQVYSNLMRMWAEV